MCRTESFNVRFPDGHVESRQRTLNCRRGTPSSPCDRREYYQIFEDRQATQEDIDEYARRNAQLIHPRTLPAAALETSPREEATFPRRENHRGVLSGLAIEIGSWNPFSSKQKRKKKMAVERSRRPDNQINAVNRLPEAPMPPPAAARYGESPRIITAVPREAADRSPTRRKKTNKHRKTKTVVLHQDDESSESSSKDDRSPSPPEPTRTHRPPKPRSPSPSRRETAAAEKEERHRRERAFRNAEAEHEARVRAQREHDDERRRERRRRIAHEERPRLETGAQREQRLRREDHERTDRAEQERQRQHEEDVQRLRAQNERRGRPPHTPGQRPRHEVELHQPTVTFQEQSDTFIEDAVEEARRRRSGGGR